MTGVFFAVLGVGLLWLARRDWSTPSRFEGDGLFAAETPGERRFWVVRRRTGALVLAFLGIATLVAALSQFLG